MKKASPYERNRFAKEIKGPNGILRRLFPIVKWAIVGKRVPCEREFAFLGPRRVACYRSLWLALADEWAVLGVTASTDQSTNQASVEINFAGIFLSRNFYIFALPLICKRLTPNYQNLYSVETEKE